jgi:hypothetical protein
MRSRTHVWSLSRVFALENIPQHIDWCIRLNSNTGLHTLIVNITDQLLGAGPLGSLFIGGVGRGDGGNSCLIVETVEIATGILELANPFVRLYRRNKVSEELHIRAGAGAGAEA